MNKKNTENRKVWFNGQIIPEKEANVSIYDSALMFGDMVFEMTRSFNHNHFLLDKHIDRLLNSAKYVGIDIQYKKEEIIKFCEEITEINKENIADLDEHRLMINISRGLLGIYENKVDAHSGVNLIISDFPLSWTVAGMGRLFDEGINAKVPNQRMTSPETIDPKIKSRSRLHYLMANKEVSEFKGENNWALLLDTDGFISEGTGSNFFIINNNKLISPEPRNMLRGISRDYVIELALELNLEYLEKNIEIYDVMDADEAFFTATPFCMLPCVSINSYKIGTGKRGKIFDSLISKWSEKVDLDIETQIKMFNTKVMYDENKTTPYKF